MTAGTVDCGLERRREDVRQAALYGLDFVEVGPDQTALEVFFLGKAPPKLDVDNISITGGSPVTVTSLRINRQRDPTLDDWLDVRVDRPGDFSTYTFALVKLDDAGRPTDQPMDG